MSKISGKSMEILQQQYQQISVHGQFWKLLKRTKNGVEKRPKFMTPQKRSKIFKNRFFIHPRTGFWSTLYFARFAYIFWLFMQVFLQKIYIYSSTLYSSTCMSMLIKRPWKTEKYFVSCEAEICFAFVFVYKDILAFIFVA